MHYSIRKLVQWLLSAWLFLVFYLQVAFAQFQPYPFKQFTLPADLPPVYSWYEDHRGFIWLGTHEGLYMFDGIHYTLYVSTSMTQGLGRELITHIIEDQHNTLWVGARSGLYQYDRTARDFIKYVVGEETYAYYFHEEKDGSFLVHAVSGVYLFYPKVNRWDKLDIDLPPDKIYAVLRGTNNDVWIGTDHIIRRFDLSDFSYQDITLPIADKRDIESKVSVNALFMDSHHQLWINTWYKGVLRYNSATATFTHFDTTPSSSQVLLHRFNSSFTEDGEGNIWMASPDHGINIYAPASGIITHIRKESPYGDGLIGNGLELMQDRARNIWIKSDLALHFLASQRPIPQVQTDGLVSVPDAAVMKFIHPQYVLAGSFFGLYGIDLKQHKVSNLSTQIGLPTLRSAEQQFVSDIEINNNNLWLATPQGLRNMTVQMREEREPVFQYIKLFPTRKGFWPSRLARIDDATLFVKGRSNTSAFAIFNQASGSFNYRELPDSMMINQVLFHNTDTMLMGIRNKGLYHYTISDSSLHKIPWKFDNEQIQIHKPVFYSIDRLHDNTYALCTENYGVLIYDPSTSNWRQIDVAPIANTNLVYRIEEDADDNLWIQTTTQLLFYNTATATLTKANAANLFKKQSPSFFMHEGKQMLATFEGKLYSIGIDDLFIKTTKPRLYFQSIQAGDRALDWESNQHITLPHSDNFITYSFIGLNYSNPEGVRYWYTIPEISDEWISLDNQTSFSIGRLSPGTYHFRVKATNDAGQWSDIVHAPVIRITPPFWRTWWFLLGMAGIAALLVAYLLQMRKKKHEAELRLRNQIARDLHDDIGSTLSGIKIFSTLASDMAEGQPELTPLLKQISDKSDVMMQSMSDIVWSINPAYDSLHDMMVRLKQYMSEVLESQNMDVEYTAHTDLRQVKISLLQRKELYLALKEIINNIARHSRCHVMRFDIARERGGIVFRIADDGIGMDNNVVTSGNGLRNIETRIRQMGGTIVRTSKTGQGVQYEIHIKTV